MGIALLALLAALPAWGDTQFRARKMTRNDVPLGKGQCDIRLQIDNEAEVTVRGDLVYIRTISGRDGRDDGSECNEPLPNRPVEDFNFEVRDSRGDIRLIAEPSRRSDYQAIVRIRDSDGGEGRYHFRLSWRITGDGFPTGRFGEPDRGRFGDRDDRRFGDLDDRRGGLAWNNAMRFSGPGRGTSTLTGYGSQRLFDASVDIDRGGRILVSFRTDSGRALTFSGSVIGADRDALKADVMSDDRSHVRGSMYLSRDSRGDVYRITLDGGNGTDRLRLDWDRR
ncbi:MAG: hypothetical protein C5B51_23980 [Terriglobia bacterium]|nr:MAG: hypothetical protein C5B51_23980 [Terriglobia bacterium]